MNVADTISVIYGGEIKNTFSQGQIDESTIGFLMAGGTKDDSKNV
jgi:simple sugar transport system ATP-binding protein